MSIPNCGLFEQSKETSKIIEEYKIYGRCTNPKEYKSKCKEFKKRIKFKGPANITKIICQCCDLNTESIQ